MDLAITKIGKIKFELLQQKFKGIGNVYKYKSIIETICNECSHSSLKYFMHSSWMSRLFCLILEHFQGLDMEIMMMQASQLIN